MFSRVFLFVTFVVFNSLSIEMPPSHNNQKERRKRSALHRYDILTHTEVCVIEAQKWSLQRLASLRGMAFKVWG